MCTFVYMKQIFSSHGSILGSSHLAYNAELLKLGYSDTGLVWRIFSKISKVHRTSAEGLVYSFIFQSYQGTISPIDFLNYINMGIPLVKIISDHQNIPQVKIHEEIKSGNINTKMVFSALEEYSNTLV